MNPSTITLTHQEAVGLSDTGEAKEGGEGKWRWGHTTQFVIQRNGTHYAYTLRYHIEEGLQDDGDVTAYEVEPISITDVYWKRVSR
jgi:hypothetical protein